MRIEGWTVRAPGEPMVLEEREESPGPGQVLIEVAGCGVCHTDLGFYYEGVPTRHPFPLVLGHEVSGIVVAAGDGAEEWNGKSVVVPAVIPCGDCPACNAGRAPVCPQQIFPGNDVHGGFASHLVVPAVGLCPVPDLDVADVNPAGVRLADLSVVADAVSTPYQAIRRSGLGRGDLAVFVGVGGIGGFGVQLAHAFGAAVVAVDIDAAKLRQIGNHGADLVLRADELDFKSLRKQVRAFAGERDIPGWRHKIFECSGTPQGQSTAFGLLGHGAFLSIVGFTAQKVEVRLSNLMAFDATAQGNWGCPPEHYPAIVDLVLSGKVALEPFVAKRPRSSINDVFAAVRDHQIQHRVILTSEA